MPRKPTAKTTARRRRVAEAIVEGKSVRAIAATEGVSPSAVSRDAGSSEVRQILAGLVSDDYIRIKSVFHQTLGVIEAAMQANRVVVDRLGAKVDLGPDHYARLTAAKRFIELTTAGRPSPKAPEPKDDKRTLTLAEFEELYRQAQAQQGGKLQ